jgi:hypothetical protein
MFLFTNLVMAHSCVRWLVALLMHMQLWQTQTAVSLQLSNTKPRQLQYAVERLREDCNLIEVDEKLLDAMTIEQCVTLSMLCCHGTQHAQQQDITVCRCFAGC